MIDHTGKAVESPEFKDWMHSLYVRRELKGPAVPENPIARLIQNDPEYAAPATPPSRGAALAVMRIARLRAMRRFLAPHPSSHQTHENKGQSAKAGIGRGGVV